MKQPEKLILASQSPRRREILKEARINFSIQTKATEEIYPSWLPIPEIPEYLARLKAEPFKSEIQNEVVITADTVVILEKQVIGKPISYDNAFTLLRALSGKKHEVITGVCIFSRKKEVLFSDLTEVYFKKLEDSEIHFYLENYKPFDKAGSYGIQDWMGCIGVTKIVGSFYNVMGLPIHKVIYELEKFV